MTVWYGGLDYDMRRLELVKITGSHTKASVRRRGGYVALIGPFRSVSDAQKELKHTGLPVHLGRQKSTRSAVGRTNPPRRGRRLSNPPSVSLEGAVQIYEDIHAIEARKGKHSLFPKGDFRHDFTHRKTSIWGLKDGNLLIVGKKPLWKNFNYPKNMDPRDYQ